MTEKEQALRLLLDRHTRAVRKSLADHLVRVFPVPAVKRALKSCPRNEEWQSLDETVERIMQVLHQPVTETHVVDENGLDLDLVTFADAAPRLDFAARTLHDLSLIDPGFPEPFLASSIGKLWVYGDLESYVLARKADDKWRARGPKKNRY